MKSPLRMIMDRNRERRSKPEEARLDMTAMIDVVFLLIIFFMLVTELSKIEVEDVTLPIALNSLPDEPVPPKRVIVNVRAASSTNAHHGALWVSGRRISPEGLRAFLHRGSVGLRDSRGISDLPIKVRADAAVEWRYIQNVMIACQKTGIWRCAFGVVRPDSLQY